MLPLSVLVTGGGGAGIDGSGSTVLVNPSTSTTDPTYVTFRKASYTPDSHGGPTPTYPNSVTMAATVTLSGVPTRQIEAMSGEPRPLSKAVVKITTDANPSTYLGSALATDDLVDWTGQTWFVIGASIYQAGSYLTIAELMT